MKNTIQNDFGRWIFTLTNSKGYKIMIRLIWKYDENNSYIIIDKIDHRSGEVLHTYYSNDYSKKNVKEARDFYDILLKSYRRKLPSYKDIK